MMKLHVYFSMLLVLGLTAPTIYCAEEHQADLGKQLYDSIISHDYVKAKQLIRAGANTNYVAFRGDMPLIAAVRHADDVELVQLLVNNKAKVNATTNVGFTPLHYLISKVPQADNFMAIADILLAAGVNINAKDKKGFTPLHVAAARGYIEEVQYLLRKGANPNVENKVGERPIDLVPEENMQLHSILLLAMRGRPLK